MEARLLARISTPLHACCIETYRPNDSSSSSSFACGLYQLEEASGEGSEVSRRGRVVLYDVVTGSELAAEETEGGVLDMKWTSGSLLACATSEGCLQLLQYGSGEGREEGVGPHCLRTVGTYRDKSERSNEEEEDEGMFLSLDWDLHQSQLLLPSDGERKIVVSTQQGSLKLFSLDSSSSSGGLRLLTTYSHEHMLSHQPVPAWIAAFNTHSQGTCFLSGGDDGVLKLFDIRSSSGSCVQMNRESHEAGVTAAQWHPERENVFVTGSYDEQLRVFDQRKLSAPLTAARAKGGIWRVKWLRRRQIRKSQDGHSDEVIEDEGCCSEILAACMHAGAKVFRYSHDNSGSSNDNSLECVVSREGGSRSPQSNHLLYGIDDGKRLTSVGDEELSEDVVISCSFYENMIEIWRSEEVD